MKKLLLYLLLFFTPATLFSQNIDFTVSQTLGCPPFTMNLTNTSTVGDSFVWYFNNTNSYDTGLNVSHSFNSIGNFMVYLTAYDSNGNYIGRKIETIVSSGVNTTIYPLADTFCPNDPINLTIGCFGIDSIYWDMGNGKKHKDVITTGSLYNQRFFEYKYTKKGTYEAKAIVYSLCGIDTIKKRITINNSRKLTGSFKTGIPNGKYCPIKSLYFLAEFYGYNNDVSQIVFDYGDGDSSVVEINENSSSSHWKYHNYIDTGTYIARIIFRNNCYSEKIFSDTIRIVDNLKEFLSDTIIIDNYLKCDAKSIRFLSPVGTSNQSVVWDFGDGHFSSVSNPYHFYNYPGNYEVKATITNGCGYDTTLHRKITVKDTLSIYGNVRIRWHKRKICPGTEIEFDYDGHVNCYEDRYWTLNDSIINKDGDFVFHKKGENIIKLVFENYGKKEYIITDTVIVVDSMPFGWVNAYSQNNPCKGNVWFGYGNSNLFDITKNKWLFSTGDSSFEKNPSVYFNSAGKYSFTLHLTNSCGSDTFVSDTFEIKNNIPLSANINLYISKKSICPGETITAYASYHYATTQIDSFIFGFGDSSIWEYENFSRVNRTFSKPGKYSISVRMVNSCGNDTIVSDTIEVTNLLPVSTNDFRIHTPDKTCLLDSASIKIYVTGSGISYQIEIDDTIWEPGFNRFYSTGYHNIKYHIQNRCGQKLVVEDSIKIVDKLPIEDNIFFETIPGSHLICNEVISFYSPSYNNSSELIYNWRFGDGDSAKGTSENTSHLYESPGNYLVSLKAENVCGTTKSYSKAIKIDSCRNHFLMTHMRIEDGDNKLYLNSNIVNYPFSFYTNPPSEYYTINWDFGDGNTSNFLKPKHSYSKEGVYHVKLKLTNKCGFSTTLRDSVIVLPVNNNPERKVFFSGFRKVCPNQTINIYSKGIFDSDSVFFVIDNIDTIFNTGFKYTFKSLGNHLVKLIVFDANNKMFSYQDTIKVSDNYNFSFSTNPGTFSNPIVGKPFRVYFGKGIYQFNYLDFGDGHIDSTPQVLYYNNDSIYLFTHTYTKTGKYVIKAGYNDWCYNYDSLEYSYVVHDSNYIFETVSGFSWNDNNSYVFENIDFYPYGGDYYIFDFGDSTAHDTCFDELEPIGHTFTKAGTYLIKCKVVRNNRPDANVYRYICISDDNMKPKVDFSVSKNRILLNDTVSFFDRSYPGKTNWHWTLNGTSIDTSILQNPAGIKYIKPGIYDVTLRIKNSYGWTSLTKPNYITVTDSTPIADLIADSTVIFKNGTVDFTDLSQNLPTSWRWEFKGGIPSVSYIQNPINIEYNDTGIFTVKLVAENSYGKDSIIKINYIKVLPIPYPVVDFESDTTVITRNGSVTFYDRTLNDPIHWDWEFEGGSPYFSNLQDPLKITYNDTGLFDVKLKAVNAFGSDSVLKPGYIKVLPYPAPFTDFIADTTRVKVGSKVNFINKSTGTITFTRWYFDGGNPDKSTLASPTNITYDSIGFYSVSLVTGNQDGFDSITKVNYIEVVDTTSAISDHYKNITFSIFPNPTENYIYLNIENCKSTEFQIDILDINARILYTNNLGTENDYIMHKINTRSFVKGTYIFKVTTKNFVLNKKFIKM